MRALAIVITLCTILSLGYANEKLADNTDGVSESENSYDAGIAAYKRGHYEAALYDFEKRAMKGDPIAQFCLGFMYKHGKGVSRDYDKASKWYIKAGHIDYGPPLNDWVVLKAQGGGHGNPTDWARLLEVPAENGNPTAQYNLGIVYFHLYKVSKDTKDLKMSIEWFHKSVEQNYPPAQFKLAELGLNFRDPYVLQKFPKNYLVELLKKAATPNEKAADPYKKGYAPAQFLLGTLYEIGKEVKKDLAEAVKWYEMAAKQGFADAQFFLGFWYDGYAKGTSGEAGALVWWTEAAKQDHPLAQYRLGNLYKKNAELYGDEAMREKATRLFLRAAQQGNANAQVALGIMFENFEEQYYWLSLALNDKETWRTGLIGYDRDTVSATRDSAGKLLELIDGQKDQVDNRIQEWKPRILYSSGTGFYVDKNHILTNEHVVRWKDNRGKKHKFDELRIGYHYVEEKSGLDAMDAALDLALLYAPRRNTDSATFATFRREPVKLGEDANVFGYPLSNLLSYQGTGTSGIVSGLLGDMTDFSPDNHFQYTAPTQPGNSGGPVFDHTGNVIGVVVSGFKYWVAQNANFAIKFNPIENFLTRNGIKAKFPQNFQVNSRIDRKEIYKKAQEFTVPVLCFRNKGEDPLPLIEIGIAGLNPSSLRVLCTEIE